MGGGGVASGGVPRAAQRGRFDYDTWTSGNTTQQVRVSVDVFSGPDFATVTQLGLHTGVASEGWKQATVDVSAFRGRVVKLRFRTDFRTDTISSVDIRAYVDTIALIDGAEAIPLGWDYHASSYLQLDGPGQWALSGPITVLTDTDSMSFDYAAWTSNTAVGQVRLSVEAVTGATFGTTMVLTQAVGSGLQGWREGVALNVSAYQGQTIKLRFRVDGTANAKVRIDNITLLTPTMTAQADAAPVASSSACKVHTVIPGTRTPLTTPTEPYIVRLARRDSDRYALLEFWADGMPKPWYAGTAGDAKGGALPNGTEGYFELEREEPFDAIYAEVCVFKDWEFLTSFRPKVDLQRAMLSRVICSRVGSSCIQDAYQRLEEAKGDISFDYYPLTISKFPRNPATGVDFTAAEFMEYVRLHINDFAKETRTTNTMTGTITTTVTLSTFIPYSIRYGLPGRPPHGIDDAAIWSSPTPVGALISILLNANDTVAPPQQHGTVAATQHTLAIGDANWIFSTAYTLGDGSHPVSGNRQFGIKSNGNGTYTFYTKGVDRLIGKPTGWLPDKAFGAADNLWTNVRLELLRYITNPINGPGAAAILSLGDVRDGRTRDSARYKWSAICQTYWHPSTLWVNRSGNFDQNMTCP